MNARNVLARETTRSLSSVPTLRALRLSDWSCLNATVAAKWVCMVCAATLGDALVWCDDGPASLEGAANVVMDGSRGGDIVGSSTVVVWLMGVVAEAWSGGAMVGAP